MAVGIGEINPQCHIWMVAKRVTDILLVLVYVQILKIGYSYWRHRSTIFPEHMKYESK